METSRRAAQILWNQIDLTGAEFVGDSGSGGQKGLFRLRQQGMRPSFSRVMERGLRYLVDRAALQALES